jgi:hypothetical protein
MVFLGSSWARMECTYEMAMHIKYMGGIPLSFGKASSLLLSNFSNFQFLHDLFEERVFGSFLGNF